MNPGDRDGAFARTESASASLAMLRGFDLITGALALGIGVLAGLLAAKGEYWDRVLALGSIALGGYLLLRCAARLGHTVEQRTATALWDLRLGVLACVPLTLPGLAWLPGAQNLALPLWMIAPGALIAALHGLVLLLYGATFSTWPREPRG